MALLIHSLVAVAAFMTGRTVRDALFLAHSHRSDLAWMYVAASLAVAIAGLLYGPVAQNFRRDLVAGVSAALFALFFFALWRIEAHGSDWVYPVLYVAVEVMGALTLLQFWTLANELFNPREAKRLYGLIGAGGTAGNILFGFLNARIATAAGASSLLPVCAALLVATATVSIWVGRLGRERLVARAAAGKLGGSAPSGPIADLRSSSHLRTVAWLAAVTFFTTTVVDYEFKVVAADSLSRDGLAAFFAYFHAGVGVLGLGLQLFGTGALLARVGVIGALAVLPLSLGGAHLLFAAVPALWTATLAKGADGLFRYSVNDATSQMLYLPLGPRARVAGKAFIDAVVKPLSIGLGGLGLVLYSRGLSGSPAVLGGAVVVLCAVWLALVASLRPEYLRSLQGTLRGLRGERESSRDGEFPAFSARLREALESGQPTQLLDALALLPQLHDLEVDHRAEELLDHPMAEVRIAALGYYAQRQTLRFANSIFRKFEDSEPKVRAAAVEAFCAIGRDKAVRSVRPFLADPEPEVRGAAITGMIRYGGLDGVLIAAEALKTLIAHSEPRMRQLAARVLGAIGVTHFYQPVLELMNDPELQVRREAVRTAGVLRSPELVIPLLYKTRSRSTAREATASLAAFGTSVLPTLAKVLGNRLEESPVRQGAARVLGRLRSPEAAELLAASLEEPDEDVREALFEGLARTVRAGHRFHERSRVEAALERELSRAFSALQAAEVLGLDASGGTLPPSASSPLEGARALLGTAMFEKMARIEHRLFLLLGALHPDADMAQIHVSIRAAGSNESRRRRANAVELLDNLLSRELKRKVLPLVDEMPRAARLEAVATALRLPSLGPAEARAQLCADESPWVRACALWVLESELGTAAEALLLAASGDLDEVVREVCLVCLWRSAPGAGSVLAETRLEDEALAVRRQAQRISGRA